MQEDDARHLSEHVVVERNDLQIVPPQRPNHSIHFRLQHGNITGDMSTLRLARQRRPSGSTSSASSTWGIEATILGY